MTLVDHRIDERMSQFWPLSHDQQELSACEIVQAAEGIRAHVWRDRDPDYSYVNRKKDALAKLLRTQPLSICVVDDTECEIMKPEMRAALAMALDEFEGTGPVSLGFLDIFVVLVRPGPDRFVDCGQYDTFDYEEKPSERLLSGPPHDLVFLGRAKSAKRATKLLADRGYFDGGV